MKRTLLSLVAVALVPAMYAAETLVGGPYVVNAGPKGGTIVWLVKTSEAKFGLKADKLDSTLPVLRAEKITLTDLKPGTTYHYDVGGADAGRGSFKTAPAGPADFKFVVYGDTRTRHEMHQRVVDAIVKTDPDFVIHTGDLVSNGTDAALWPRFFAIEKELLRKAPIYTVLGNHERNTPQFYDFFDVKTPYFSFDWGNVHFILLDTDLGNMPGRDAFWAEQTKWLEADLKGSGKAAMRIVVFHHPPFTAVKKRQEEGKQVRELVPLFEQYKVAAVFAGHDHNYQHHLKNGIHYIVTGGGGAPLYPVDGPIPDVTQKVLSTEHYVQVKVTGNTARIEAIGLDGSLIDGIDIK
jgi:3',5'-cyclic AMP phosphodiesterase CpdA